MAVKVRDDNTEFPDVGEYVDDDANGIAYDEDEGLAPASDSGDWVDALIEGGELSAIHEALAQSITDASRAHRKWSKAEEKYGGKLRALRDDFEANQSNTNRLFAAATRGLA